MTLEEAIRITVSSMISKNRKHQDIMTAGKVLDENKVKRIYDDGKYICIYIERSAFE